MHGSRFVCAVNGYISHVTAAPQWLNVSSDVDAYFHLGQILSLQLCLPSDVMDRDTRRINSSNILCSSMLVYQAHNLWNSLPDDEHPGDGVWLGCL